VYWNRNHTIDYNGSRSKFVTSPQAHQLDTSSRPFRLEANLAAGNITITSIFKYGTVTGDVTNAQKTATVTAFKARVGDWSNRFQMKITDPICGERTLPIRFRLLWAPDDTSDAHQFSVNLYKTYPRAGVTGTTINIGYDSDVTPDSGWTLTHEYGHTFGLPDEYFHPGVTAATLTYKKADGSTETITLEPAGDSIMKTYGNTTYLKRFYYFSAIEAQELLRRESGRNVTCEII
jgi:hypothetical protein